MPLLRIVAMRARFDNAIAIGMGVACALAAVAVQVIYQFRGVVKPRGEGARFQHPPPRR